MLILFFFQKMVMNSTIVFVTPPPKILRFYFSLRSCVAFSEALKGFPPFFSHQPKKKAIWLLALYFTDHIGHIVVVIYRDSLPELFSRRDR